VSSSWATERAAERSVLATAEAYFAAIMAARALSLFAAFGTANALAECMTPLALTTTYERAPAIDTAARQLAFEQQLRQYVAAHGWTLGTLLARTLLAIMTVMVGKGDVGTVLFGRVD
jgi:hypothetical protein